MKLSSRGPHRNAAELAGLSFCVFAGLSFGVFHLDNPDLRAPNELPVLNDMPCGPQVPLWMLRSSFRDDMAQYMGSLFSFSALRNTANCTLEFLHARHLVRLAPSYTGQEVGVAVAIQARIARKEKLWTSSTVKKILQTWVSQINTSKIHVFFVLTNLAEMFPRGGAMDNHSVAVLQLNRSTEFLARLDAWKGRILRNDRVASQVHFVDSGCNPAADYERGRVLSCKLAYSMSLGDAVRARWLVALQDDHYVIPRRLEKMLYGKQSFWRKASKDGVNEGIVAGGVFGCQGTYVGPLRQTRKMTPVDRVVRLFRRARGGHGGERDGYLGPWEAETTEDYRRRMLTLWGHAWTVDDGARGNLTHTDTHTGEALEAFVWDASPPPSADEGAAGEPGVAFNATSLRPAGEWYAPFMDKWAPYLGQKPVRVHGRSRKAVDILGMCAGAGFFLSQGAIARLLKTKDAERFRRRLRRVMTQPGVASDKSTDALNYHFYFLNLMETWTAWNVDGTSKRGPRGEHNPNEDLALGHILVNGRGFSAEGKQGGHLINTQETGHSWGWFGNEMDICLKKKKKKTEKKSTPASCAEDWLRQKPLAAVFHYVPDWVALHRAARGAGMP